MKKLFACLLCGFIALTVNGCSSKKATTVEEKIKNADYVTKYEDKSFKMGPKDETYTFVYSDSENLKDSITIASHDRNNNYYMFTRPSDMIMISNTDSHETCTIWPDDDNECSEAFINVAKAAKESYNKILSDLDITEKALIDYMKGMFNKAAK